MCTGNVLSAPYSYYAVLTLCCAQVIPGATSGSTPVYEDDGQTTAYLTNGASAWTTGAYTMSANTATFTISTNGTFPELPSARAYQVLHHARRLRTLHCGVLNMLPRLFIASFSDPLLELASDCECNGEWRDCRLQPVWPHCC